MGLEADPKARTFNGNNVSVFSCWYGLQRKVGSTFIEIGIVLRLL